MDHKFKPRLRKQKPVESDTESEVSEAQEASYTVPTVEVAPKSFWQTHKYTIAVIIVVLVLVLFGFFYFRGAATSTIKPDVAKRYADPPPKEAMKEAPVQEKQADSERTGMESHVGKPATEAAKKNEESSDRKSARSDPPKEEKTAPTHEEIVKTVDDDEISQYVESTD